MVQPEIIRWDQAYNRNGDGKLPRATVNAIRTYMDNHTLEGWVKQETLAEATGLTDRQVRRHIAANVAAGWLQVTKQGRTGQASEYRLAYPQPDTDVRLGQEDIDVRLAVNRTSGAHHPDADVRFEPDTGVRPTTPATSPRTSPQREVLWSNNTIEDQPDTDVRLDHYPDPWGSVVDLPPEGTTSPTQPDSDVRLDPWLPVPQHPPATPSAAELLLSQLAKAPLHEASADYPARLTPADTKVLVRQLIRDKKIIRDAATGMLRLAQV